MARLARPLAYLTTLAATLAIATPASACTGVIVGSDLTEDGSTFVGRTEDLEQRHPKRLLVHEAGEYSAGTVLTGAETGVTYTQPKDSLKYTSISDVTPEEGRFDEAGFNSAGVAIDATISARSNAHVVGSRKEPDIVPVDPYTEKGWTEGFLATVLLANATSAREAVELMGQLIDKDGASEGNILVAVDKHEVWYMEIYSGHQYIAMKYPSDAFSIMPNAYWLNFENCSDPTTFICSDGIVETVKKAGTYTETDGRFNPAGSYNPQGVDQRNASRVWSGIKFLDPGSPVTIHDDSYPLLNHPSGDFTKVNIADLMALQRNRFEKVDPGLQALSKKVVVDSGLKGLDGKPVEGAAYPIGNTNTMEAHIIQIPASGLSEQVPGTMWQTIGTPQGSPYLPYYGNINSTIEPMQSTSLNEDDMQSYYWLASAVNFAVDADRETLQSPVREYLNMIEDPAIKARPAQDAEMTQLLASDPTEAAAVATNEFTAISWEAFDDLTALHASLDVYNTEHRLVAENGASMTAAPGQVILPTVFRIQDATVEAGEGESVLGAWDMSLVQKLPYGAERAVTLDRMTTFTIPVDADTKAAMDKGSLEMVAVDGEGRHTLPYQVGDDSISFQTEQVGRVALIQKSVAPTEPTVAPADTSEHSTAAPSAPAKEKETKAVSKKVKKGKGEADLARTGADAGLLALTGMMVVAGGLALAVRRIKA
ncbi:dipeptidase [Actinomyces vulturis]|uniref:dipeptidase n=1 Tax=Actinomyces vulturis TaxID=1857645 RepID=UPI00082DC819|nr:C69 family dipeptidase [Actinomyces vulturis]